jgi:predicted dehydrogenase
VPVKVRWGVLGAANIAVKKVIPAMQRGTWSEIVGLASREATRAQRVAASLGIPRAYSSYEDLLDDPDIEAVYIPLPNHLHVHWATKAAESGKHVLCEKPIALSATEAARLIDVRDATGVLIQEAFMIRSHPQWLKAVDLVRNGSLGAIQSIVGYFSYYNIDPANVRNIRELGGGGLADIGCYLVHAARWLLGREPRRLVATADVDPKFGTDRLVSMLLDFDGAQVIGMCATQLVPSQRIHVFGDRGRLEIEIPFNAPTDRPCRILIDDGSSLAGGVGTTIELPTCDQYTLQGDDFSRAIRFGHAQTLPLEDSVANMRVLDAVVRSTGEGTWQIP